MVDIPNQIKVVTLEIVKIHIAESEHRVAHLVLHHLCQEYPDDPHLYGTLGKLYLDIGKRQAAVVAFGKMEENLPKSGKVSKEVIEAHKFINMYNGFGAWDKK